MLLRPLVYKCLLSFSFNFFWGGYTSKRAISGSYGNFIPHLLRNCHTIFRTCCAISHPHQQRARVQFPHILANIWYFLGFWGVVFFCFIAAILMGMKSYLIVVLKKNRIFLQLRNPSKGFVCVTCFLNLRMPAAYKRNHTNEQCRTNPQVSILILLKQHK